MKLLTTAAVTVAVAAWANPVTSQVDRNCAVRYIANAGVLFETKNRSFLIDSPIREGIPPYATPTEAQRQAVESARPPFQAVSAILITHWHEDHLSAEAVAAQLRASPDTVLVSSQEVVERVRGADSSLPAQRFVAITPGPGESRRTLVAQVPVHVLRIRHNPARRLPEQHVGFLIEGCQTLLHSGDADPVADNFGVLKSLPPVQVGVLPFWYVLDEDSRAMVRSAIGPSRVLAVHLPPDDVPDVSRRLAGVPDVTLLTQPNQRVSVGR
jgi:L-ascorbate metabolism protein UlaG (beta-lactamase superfamily)